MEASDAVKAKTIKKLLRAEMLLDSHQQEGDRKVRALVALHFLNNLEELTPHERKDERKVAIALAYIRACRQDAKKEQGWQWTLTSPSKNGMTREESIKGFGYDEPKKWFCGCPPMILTRKELKMIPVSDT